ncbi:MAG TPA: DUF3710 domain-containing protein [Mycobacteriales bacterium]|nr:DUF3710 domain-containing protein [Mycobacteriales bacterium]
MFRRRRRGDADDADPADDVPAADEAFDDDTEGPDDELDDEDPTAAAQPPEPGRPNGPWDVADAPDGPRFDLGAVQLPIAEGMELRVDVQDQVVVAATLIDGHSMVQIHAFAAPRSAGIWPDVREEIARSLRESGGEATDQDGPFGTELRARIPVEAPGQGPTLQPARFVGVDGPRWFLRGMFTGPAATDAVQAKRLEDVFRGTVVVRGGDAMAPRELLPLRLPKEAMEQAAASSARPGLEMLERGPEITETR